MWLINLAGLILTFLLVLFACDEKRDRRRGTFLACQQFLLQIEAKTKSRRADSNR
jgi:hypothetical protein